MILFDKKIHFVGVGGVSMSALAEFALKCGAKVSGYDRELNYRTERLLSLGVPLCLGCRTRVDNADAVVYSSAVPLTNPVLAYAKERGISLVERRDFLGEASALFSCVVAVAGTHGKSTVTAMLAKILDYAGLSYVAHIGADDVEHSGLYHSADVDFASLGRGEKQPNTIFLTEACEYKQSLLSLRPDVALVLNAECDHPDCYANYEQLKDVFQRFANGARIAVVDEKLQSMCDGDCVVVKLSTPTSGDEPPSFATATNAGRVTATFKCANPLTCVDEHTGVVREKYCVQTDDGKSYGVEQCVAGEYNAVNGTFAIAAAVQLGVDVNTAVEALAAFKPVPRRFESAGKLGGAYAVFDYAHHPGELRAVITLSKQIGKTLVVFQPHTYSRTRAYLGDFASALALADGVIVAPTFAARESVLDGVDESVLFRVLRAENPTLDLALASTLDEALVCARERAPRFKVVLFAGAGDVYDLKSKLNEL